MFDGVSVSETLRSCIIFYFLIPKNKNYITDFLPALTSNSALYLSAEKQPYPSRPIFTMQNDYSQHQSKYTGQSIADQHNQPHGYSARQIGTIEEKEKDWQAEHKQSGKVQDKRESRLAESIK